MLVENSANAHNVKTRNVQIRKTRLTEHLVRCRKQ